MECEEARKRIVDFFYDELEPDTMSSLQEHLARCDNCSEYKQEVQSAVQCLEQQKEIQSSIDLVALHDAIERKSRTWSLFSYRLPVWGTVLFVLFGIVLSAFALTKTEVQYTNNTLTIRFGEPTVVQQAQPQTDPIAQAKLQAKLQAKIDDLTKRTDKILTEYKKDQLKFQSQLTKEMRDSHNTTLKMIKDYESRRDVQLANLVQQIQLQHYQSLVAMKNEFELLASQTEKEFKRSYSTMAAMAGLLSYQSGQ
jgi:hypothetical protein